MQRVSLVLAMSFVVFAVSQLAGSQPASSQPVSAPDSSAYWKAARTSALVEALKQETPPAEIKAALLNTARAEDRDFAKRLLIQWKKNSRQNVEAEFDRVILRDSRGDVVLMIHPIDGKSSAFRINGREWEIPASGSMAFSIKKFLLKKPASESAAASVFDAITPLAHASDDLVPGASTAFLYAFNIEQGGAPATALGHLSTYPPQGNLLPSEGGILSRIAGRLKGKSQVQCSKDSASGRIVIAGQPVEFVVRKDGTMTLKGHESPHIVKVESSVAVHSDASQVYDRDIRFTPCLDRECTKTAGPSHYSLKPYIKNPEDEFVNTALTFRPRDAKKPTYPIEFACKSDVDCHHMEVRDLKSLSADDRKWALKYRDQANEALRKTRAKLNADVLSIRPLYACCQDAACVAAVLRNGIELKNSEAPAKGRGVVH